MRNGRSLDRPGDHTLASPSHRMLVRSDTGSMGGPTSNEERLAMSGADSVTEQRGGRLRVRTTSIDGEIGVVMLLDSDGKAAS
jgi:hypothetical protein